MCCDAAAAWMPSHEHDHAQITRAPHHRCESRRCSPRTTTLAAPTGPGSPSAEIVARQPDELARLRQDHAARTHHHATWRQPAGRGHRGRPGDAASTPSGSGAPAAPVVQINTGAGCHLDAAMVHGALHDARPGARARCCSSRTSATWSARRCSTSARRPRWWSSR